jgi:hypothetical protein
MPKTSFYLRNEDIDKWKAVEEKSAWIHAMLHQLPEPREDPPLDDIKFTDLDTHDQAIVVLQERGVSLPKSKLLMYPNGLCKIHGIALDNRGRCLQKGCKYA